MGVQSGLGVPTLRRTRRKERTVFERFTERARQVVVLAQEEARILKHNYIGTEHILLGLLREEEGLAARVLESLRSEEHTSELQSRQYLVCRLLLEKKKNKQYHL